MKKIQERLILDSVYGDGLGWSVEASESPDFLCRRDGEVVLGVEVTEYFSSDTSARLRHLPGYGSSLINGGRYRHKADKKELRVDLVSVLSEAGGVKASDIPALTSTLSPMSHQFDRLTAMVQAKASKHPLYVNKASVVDLVVGDTGYAFWHKEYEFFYSHFCQNPLRTAVVESPFREVFLLTRCDAACVFMPLKASAFVEEVLLLREAYWNHNPQGSFQKLFRVLVAALAEAGFATAVVSREGKAALTVRYGSVDVCFGTGGLRIRDYAALPEREANGHPIAALLASVTSKDRETTVEAQRWRQQHVSFPNLSLAARLERFGPRTRGKSGGGQGNSR